MNSQQYRIGLSADLRADDGSISWGDISLGLLDEAGLGWRFTGSGDELTCQDLRSFDAILSAAPELRAAAIDAAADVPLIIARFGVGVDAIDLDACTRRGILVTNTPDGARRPVAQAALTLMLSTVHHLAAKDRMARSGEWGSRLLWNGRSLNGATVGIVGLGNIGGEFARLLSPFDVRLLAFDPYQDDAAFERARAVRRRLDAVLAQSDVVVIFAPLTAQTHHLINLQNIFEMKPGAYLVNIARGPIVEHAALVAALSSGHLAGAGLDVFEVEPLPVDDPLVGMHNVVLAPHALSWTDEMARDNGASAIRAILDVRDGRVPPFVVNRGALDHPRLRDRLAHPLPA